METQHANHDPDGDTEDAEGATEDTSEFPDRPAGLERDHLPQQLVDEIQRPLKAQVRALGKAYADALDSYNDRVSGLQSELKAANKDSQRINQVHTQNPHVQDALQTAGIVDAPNPDPEGGGGRG